MALASRSATSLLCGDGANFTCPRCEGHLDNEARSLLGDSVNGDVGRVFCTSCRHFTRIQLPPLRKKIVYLDQSLISDFLPHYRSDIPPLLDNSVLHARLLAKLFELKLRQKLHVVVSDLHAMETVSIPDKSKCQSTWELACALSDGDTTGELSEVVANELRAIVVNEVGPPPRSGGMRSRLCPDADEWKLRFQVVPSRNWQLKLQQQMSESREQWQDRYRAILQGQASLARVQNCQSVEDCVELVRSLTVSDLLEAITDLENEQEFFASMAANARTNALPTLRQPSASPFRSTLRYALNHVIKQEDLRTIRNVVEKRGLDAFCSLKISTAFEGKLLWDWLLGYRQNPKAFNRNFGLSRNMDIQHLCCFAPVADALIVDNDTYQICQRKPLADELEHFGCNLFSTRKLESFDIWLTELLNQPEEPSVRDTRRLFVGENAHERAARDDVEVQKIVRSFIDLVKNIEK